MEKRKLSLHTQAPPLWVHPVAQCSFLYDQWSLPKKISMGCRNRPFIKTEQYTPLDIARTVSCRRYGGLIYHMALVQVKGWIIDMFTPNIFIISMSRTGCKDPHIPSSVKRRLVLPPRCAQTDLELHLANREAPGSPPLLHSRGVKGNPTGSGHDLQGRSDRQSPPRSEGRATTVLQWFLCFGHTLPLKEDSKMGAGFCARKSFLAYLLRAPLFSVGTMSWRMKRARSRMS